MNQQKMTYLFNFALVLCYLIVMLLVLFYSVGKSGAVLDIYQVQIVGGLAYLEFMVSAMYMILIGLNTYPIAKQKIKSQQSRNPNNPHTPLYTFIQILKTIYIDEQESTHALILFLISLYGSFFEIRIYSFSLIFAFTTIQVLDSILKSIRLTWQQLVFVCLLALAFSFIFGFITLNYYIGPLYQNQEIDIDIDRINQHCNSVITCVSSLYTQKIIGESVSRQDEEYNYGRFVSDLVYWGFFQILLSNIIAAIIIDKFAQQRNAKQKIEYQRYSKCYICFADRNTLERRGQDFMSHVNNVHNLWNYFFYMYTLENLKDITDFTGIQYWINRQVKHNQIDWIPIDDSFKDEDVSLQELVDKLRPLLVQKEEHM